MQLVKKILSGQYLVVLKNFISLFILQGANFILPLLTIPYLTRVLGPEKFGLSSFAVAFASYFNILIDYGFNLSATKEISVVKKDKERVNSIFTTVFAIKGILLMAAGFIYIVLILVIPALRMEWRVFAIAFGVILGNALFPTWIYQGMENMKYITIINLGSRLVFTGFVFILIKTEDDYIKYFMLNSGTFLLCGIVSFLTAIYVFKLKFTRITFEGLKKQALEGWNVFISSVGIVLYSSSTTFVLGLFGGNTAAGYFAGADKIRQAIQGMFSPFFQAVYPFIGKLVSTSRERAIKVLRLELLGVIVVGVVTGLIIFIKADLLVYILLGEKYQASIQIVKILAPMPLLVAIDNVITVQTLLAFNLNRAYSQIYLSTSIIGIILIIAFTWLWGGAGTAASIVIIEFLVMLFSVYKLVQNRLPIFFKGV